MAGNWSIDDKRKIVEAYTVLTYSLKSYGEDNVKERLRAWEAIMSDEYTADQVCAAMVAYAKKATDIPTPADLIKIINPPPVKISVSEYNHAVEQWKAEGYKTFCYWKGIMNDFEKQQSQESDVPSYKQILEKRENAKITNGLKAIGND